jgi:hypothetical protein
MIGILLAIIGLVGGCVIWIRRSKGRTRTQLLGLGFEPCDDAEAPALEQLLVDVVGGRGGAAKRRFKMGQCFKKPSGWGFAYLVSALDLTRTQGGRRDSTGGHIEAFIANLPDPERVAQGPISVFFGPASSKMLRKLLAGVLAEDPFGIPLELPSEPDAPWIAAFGENAGKLTDVLHQEARERLTRGAELGFFAAHLADGKAVFVTPPNAGDPVARWMWVEGWL